MSKITMNELRHTISDILNEAKKKKDKAEKMKKIAAQVEAFGHYDEEHDFSTPLGAQNLYRQQGAVNYGPFTSSGPSVDNHGAGNPNTGLRESDEKALRSLVREVIQNGLVTRESAWAPFLKNRQPIFESSWEEADHLFEAWYDEFKKSKKEEPKKKSKKDTDYGAVKKHGQEKKDKK